MKIDVVTTGKPFSEPRCSNYWHRTISEAFDMLLCELDSHMADVVQLEPVDKATSWGGLPAVDWTKTQTYFPGRIKPIMVF